MKFDKLERVVGEGGTIEISLTASADAVHDTLADLYGTISHYKHLGNDATFEEVEAAAEPSFPPDYFKEMRRDFVVSTVSSEAFKELGVVPALTPKIHAVDYPADGEPYSFELSIVERPAFALSSYEPVVIDLAPVVVTNEMVHDKLEEILDGHAKYEQVGSRPIERGDYVLLDVVTQKNDKIENRLSCTKTILHVDDEAMPSKFIDGIVGMSPGDTKVIKYEMPRPRGISANDVDRYIATVTVHSLQREIRPVFDDEFVLEYYPQVRNTYRFLEELRRDLEYDALVANKDSIAHLANTVIEKRLIGEVPDAFYQASFERQMNKLQKDLKKQGMSLDDYCEENQTNENELSMKMLIKSGENLRQAFALETLFDGRNMTFDPGDLEDAYKRVFGKSDYDEDDLKSSGKFGLVESAAKRVKALNWLVDTAVINNPMER